MPARKEEGETDRERRIREALDRYSDDCGDEGLLTADGLHEAVIGIARRCGQPDIVVYSIPKAIECLVKQGMTEEESDEYLEFNSIGAWVGEQTPAWMIPIESLIEEEEEGDDDDDD